jgi:hypothetical protein
MFALLSVRLLPAPLSARKRNRSTCCGESVLLVVMPMNMLQRRKLMPLLHQPSREAPTLARPLRPRDYVVRLQKTAELER